MLSGVVTAQAADGAPSAGAAWDTIKLDYQAFYTRDRLLRLGLVYAGGAIVANTSIDHDIGKWYHDDVRSDFTDDVGRFTKNFGEVKYVLPTVMLAASLDYLFDPSTIAGPIGRWGRRTARAYLVGIPAVALMQRVTGASRPGEGAHPSHWDPMEDDNGVSGHAFAGSVPFLTIARMNEDRPALKYLFYAASTLTTWSRFNDASHFFSQAVLGWYMGYESVDAVADVSRRADKLAITPMISPDGVALFAHARF